MHCRSAGRAAPRPDQCWTVSGIEMKCYIITSIVQGAETGEAPTAIHAVERPSRLEVNTMATGTTGVRPSEEGHGHATAGL